MRETEKCQFFNDKIDQHAPDVAGDEGVLLRIDKVSYTRYMVSTAGHNVPPDLFPHMTQSREGDSRTNVAGEPW